MSFPDFSEPFGNSPKNQSNDNIQIENMGNMGGDPYDFGTGFVPNYDQPREVKNNPQDIWGNLNNADAFAVVVFNISLRMKKKKDVLEQERKKRIKGDQK